MAIDLYDCILETFHPLRIYDDKVPTKSHWEFYMKLIANAVALIAVTSFALLPHVVYAAEPAGEEGSSSSSSSGSAAGGGAGIAGLGPAGLIAAGVLGIGLLAAISESGDAGGPPAGTIVIMRLRRANSGIYMDPKLIGLL